MENHSYLRCFSIIHRFSIMHHLKELRTYKISGHQMGYIMCICKKPGVSQEQVSTFLRLNKGAVAKGIRPLIEEGYIRRVQNEKDRRAYHLYPTDKAQEILTEAQKSMLSLEQVLTQGMSQEEEEMFKSLLTRACNNVMEAAGADQNELTHPGPHHDICPHPPRDGHRHHR